VTKEACANRRQPLNELPLGHGVFKDKKPKQVCYARSRSSAPCSAKVADGVRPGFQHGGAIRLSRTPLCPERRPRPEGLDRVAT
jgi:hypothetical protein